MLDPMWLSLAKAARSRVSEVHYRLHIQIEHPYLEDNI